MAAIPEIAGIVLGSVLLLAVAWSGVSAVLLAHNAARIGLALAGAAYLMWFGLSLLIPSSTGQAAPGSMPDGPTSLFLFQFLNPKAWMLVTAVSATALSAPIEIPLFIVAALTAGVTGVCLLAWAALGASASPLLAGAARRRRFEQLLGLSLIVSAVPLLVY